MSSRLVIGKRHVKKLISVRAAVVNVDGRIDEIDQLIEGVSEKRERIKQLKERLTSLEEDLHEQSEGRCPLCGNVLDEMGEFMLKNKLGPGDMKR